MWDDKDIFWNMRFFQEKFYSTTGLFLGKPTLPDLWLDKLTGSFSSSCKVFLAVTGEAKLSVHQHIGLE